MQASFSINNCGIPAFGIPYDWSILTVAVKQVIRDL